MQDLKVADLPVILKGYYFILFLLTRNGKARDKSHRLSHFSKGFHQGTLPVNECKGSTERVFLQMIILQWGQVNKVCEPELQCKSETEVYICQFGRTKTRLPKKGAGKPLRPRQSETDWMHHITISSPLIAIFQLASFSAILFLP